MRPLTDEQFTRLVPLAAGFMGFGGKRDYEVLERRGLVERRDGITRATTSGRELVSQQLTRLIVLRSAGVWHGLRQIK